MSIVVGQSRALSSAVLASQPIVGPAMTPGVGMLSDDRDVERVVRVWTDDHQWWTSSFTANDVSQVRAMVYLREATDAGECVTSFPLRPRGVAFGARPGALSLSVAIWTLDGSPVPDPTGAKIYASVGPGRPQLQAVGVQSFSQTQGLWWQPDKYDGSFGTIGTNFAGCRFADVLRLSWAATPGPPARIFVIRGLGGPPTAFINNEWGQIDLVGDNILQVIPQDANTIVTATAMVYR